MTSVVLPEAVLTEILTERLSVRCCLLCLQLEVFIWHHLSTFYLRCCWYGYKKRSFRLQKLAAQFNKIAFMKQA